VVKSNSKIGVCLQLAVVLLTAALVGSAPAGPVARHKAKPFRGRFEGTVTITILTPPFIDALLEAEGRASGLGRFTLSEPHHVNLDTASAVAAWRFVSANGDTLTAEGLAYATPTEDPDVLLIMESATITGGTGRFAGATGNFTVERLFNGATGNTSASFEGTIVLAKGKDRGGHDCDD
jgi:hypothetical protein